MGIMSKFCCYTDLVLYDVKHYDPEQYQRITGQPIARTMQFIKAVKECGTPLWVRHVVVPGLTESEEHFRRLRAYAETLPNVQKLELLPYHCLGSSKYSALQLPYPLEGCSPMNRTLCGEYEKRFFQNIGGGAACGTIKYSGKAFIREIGRKQLTCVPLFRKTIPFMRAVRIFYKVLPFERKRYGAGVRSFCWKN